VIQSRRIREAEHEVEMRNAYIIVVGRCERRVKFKDIGIYGRIILKCMLKISDVILWTGFIWHRL
jgi:hypothetical protein